MANYRIIKKYVSGHSIDSPADLRYVCQWENPHHNGWTDISIHVDQIGAESWMENYMEKKKLMNIPPVIIKTYES